MSAVREFTSSSNLATMPEKAQKPIQSLQDKDPPVDAMRSAIPKHPALPVKRLRLSKTVVADKAAKALAEIECTPVPLAQPCGSDRRAGNHALKL